MKKQLTHFDKLDAVLKIFSKGSEAKISDNVPLHQLSRPEIKEFLINETPSIEITDYELFLILNKLHYDKYIELLPNEFYRLNYIGYMFIQNNGFTGQMKKDSSKIQIQNLKDGLMILGTYLAGIGTILLFLVEVYKIHHCLNE